jgi:hypothetical protein
MDNLEYYRFDSDFVINENFIQNNQFQPMST